MVSIRSILQFVFFTAPSLSPPGNSPKIQWIACTEAGLNDTLALECANLNVPLDYTDSISNETLELELARVPAVFQPSKGSILFNFGGPGLPSRGILALLAPALVQ